MNDSLLLLNLVAKILDSHWGLSLREEGYDGNLDSNSLLFSSIVGFEAWELSCVIKFSLRILFHEQLIYTNLPFFTLFPLLIIFYIQIRMVHSLIHIFDVRDERSLELWDKKTHGPDGVGFKFISIFRIYWTSWIHVSLQWFWI